VRVAVAVRLPTADRLGVDVVEDVAVPDTGRVRVVVVVGLRDTPGRDRVVVVVAVAVAGTKARVRVPDAVRVPAGLDRVRVAVGLGVPTCVRLTVGVGDATARLGEIVGWVFPIANRDTNRVSNLICYSKGNNK